MASFHRIHSRLILSQDTLAQVERVELHDTKVIFFQADNNGGSAFEWFEFQCKTQEEAQLLMNETSEQLCAATVTHHTNVACINTSTGPISPKPARGKYFEDNY